jgi:hypothetical protein
MLLRSACCHITQVLSRCASVFKHAVPSYRLNELRTVSDVLAYYQQPWHAHLRLRDRPLFHQLDMGTLPSNLRIQM